MDQTEIAATLKNLTYTFRAPDKQRICVNTQLNN